MKVLKTAQYVFGSVAFIAAAAFAAPGKAYAATGAWTPTDIIGGDAINPTTIDENVVSGWVRTFTTWIIGIAVVIFVLRVVITAVDRMLFRSGSSDTVSRAPAPGGGGGNGDSPLSDLPAIIRPYDDKWGAIFKRFAIQLAVCAGAWLAVNIISGIILWAFASLTS